MKKYIIKKTRRPYVVYNDNDKIFLNPGETRNDAIKTFKMLRGKGKKRIRYATNKEYNQWEKMVYEDNNEPW
jgi:hypothetical protein